eukprot:8595391-Lingulodinium_polyedra.AAC.1
MPGDQELLRLGRGVLPGDPWGDYMYSLMAAIIEDEIEQAASRAGIKAVELEHIPAERALLSNAGAL